jgi:hypothetical protein
MVWNTKCILIWIFSKLCTQEIRDLCSHVKICSCVGLHFFEFENCFALGMDKEVLDRSVWLQGSLTQASYTISKYRYFVLKMSLSEVSIASISHITLYRYFCKMAATLVQKTCLELWTDAAGHTRYCHVWLHWNIRICTLSVIRQKGLCCLCSYLLCWLSETEVTCQRELFHSVKNVWVICLCVCYSSSSFVIHTTVSRHL